LDRIGRWLDCQSGAGNTIAVSTPASSAARCPCSQLPLSKRFGAPTLARYEWPMPGWMATETAQKLRRSAQSKLRQWMTMNEETQGKRKGQRTPKRCA